MIIYLLTAIGFTSGGSSTVNIYTKTIHRTTKIYFFIVVFKVWIFTQNFLRYITFDTLENYINTLKSYIDTLEKYIIPSKIT